MLRRLALATAALVLITACAAQARTVRISEYRLSDARLDTLRDRWEAEAENWFGGSLRPGIASRVGDVAHDPIALGLRAQKGRPRS